MKSRFVILPLFILVLVPLLKAGEQAQISGKTVWSGIYSVEQVPRGEAGYKASCARCHGAALEGTEGNGLQGKDFMQRWHDDNMGSLFQFVSENMPPNRRGVGRPLISIPTYLDILAYVLSQNQFPPGPNPLTVEGLDDIQIQYKDGPRPLSSGALVRISGCLAGSGQVWTINGANDPLRTRTSETTDYEEFKAAEAAPAGTQTYRLFNLGFLSKTFQPESHVGAKLLVKGNLIRQADSVRLSVLAIRKVADSCP